MSSPSSGCGAWPAQRKWPEELWLQVCGQEGEGLRAACAQGPRGLLPAGGGGGALDKRRVLIGCGRVGPSGSCLSCPHSYPITLKVTAPVWAPSLVPAAAWTSPAAFHHLTVHTPITRPLSASRLLWPRARTPASPSTGEMSGPCAASTRGNPLPILPLDSLLEPQASGRPSLLRAAHAVPVLSVEREGCKFYMQACPLAVAWVGQWERHLRVFITFLAPV